MVNIQGRWSHCQQLAEELKRRSLQLPSSPHYVPAQLSDAENTTAEAVEDLKRRSDNLRQRYRL